MATLIFSILFGRLARMPSDGVPYPVFAYVAMVPWQHFANALTESSNSLVASQNVIKKVYFPRLIIPLGSVIAGLVDSCFAFIVLIGMMYHYGIGGGLGPANVWQQHQPTLIFQAPGATAAFYPCFNFRHRNLVALSTFFIRNRF